MDVAATPPPAASTSAPSSSSDWLEEYATLFEMLEQEQLAGDEFELDCSLNDFDYFDFDLNYFKTIDNEFGLLLGLDWMPALYQPAGAHSAAAAAQQPLSITTAPATKTKLTATSHSLTATRTASPLRPQPPHTSASACKRAFKPKAGVSLLASKKKVAKHSYSSTSPSTSSSNSSSPIPQLQPNQQLHQPQHPIQPALPQPYWQLQPQLKSKLQLNPQRSQSRNNNEQTSHVLAKAAAAVQASSLKINHHHIRPTTQTVPASSSSSSSLHPSSPIQSTRKCMGYVPIEHNYCLPHTLRSTTTPATSHSTTIPATPLTTESSSPEYSPHRQSLTIHERKMS